jgi:hypothetical protein
MRKKLLFIVLLFISNTLYSQLFTAKTFSFCTMKKGERWSSWTEKELVNFPIEVDSVENIILVHSNKLQTYTIYSNNLYINEGEKVYWFYCQDREKLSCMIEVVLDRNGLNKNEITIRYADIKIRYELK